jgi:hypothetical protein
MHEVEGYEHRRRAQPTRKITQPIGLLFLVIVLDAESAKVRQLRDASLHGRTIEIRHGGGERQVSTRSREATPNT